MTACIKLYIENKKAKNKMFSLSASTISFTWDTQSYLEKFSFLNKNNLSNVD